MKRNDWIWTIAALVLTGALIVATYVLTRPEKVSAFVPEDTVEVIPLPDQITRSGEPVTLEGEMLQVGDTLTDDPLNGTDGTQVIINEVSGWKVVESIPAIETKVCSLQTVLLNTYAKSFPDATFFVVSQDPIETCASFQDENNIDSLTILSDAGSFAQNNGLYLSDLGMNARAIFILNPDNEIVYVEYADDLGDYLDLTNALTYLYQNQ